MQAFSSLGNPELFLAGAAMSEFDTDALEVRDFPLSGGVSDSSSVFLQDEGNRSDGSDGRKRHRATYNGGALSSHATTVFGGSPETEDVSHGLGEFGRMGWKDEDQDDIHNPRSLGMLGENPRAMQERLKALAGNAIIKQEGFTDGQAKQLELREKRAKHNEGESKRRQKLNEQFQTLAIAISSKMKSKPAILQDSIKKVQALTEENEALKRTLSELRTNRDSIPSSGGALDFSQVFYSCNLPRAITDLSGRIIACNAYFSQLLGVSQTELTSANGPSHFSFIHRSSISDTFTRVGKIVSGTVLEARVPITYVHKSKNLIPVILTIHLVALKTGEKPNYLDNFVVPQSSDAGSHNN